jgi:hypothetical protein
MYTVNSASADTSSSSRTSSLTHAFMLTSNPAIPNTQPCRATVAELHSSLLGELSRPFFEQLVIKFVDALPTTEKLNRSHLMILAGVQDIRIDLRTQDGMGCCV